MHSKFKSRNIPITIGTETMPGSSRRKPTYKMESRESITGGDPIVTTFCLFSYRYGNPVLYLVQGRVVF